MTLSKGYEEKEKEKQETPKYLKPSADASPPPFQTAGEWEQRRYEYQSRSPRQYNNKKSHGGGFAAIMILGVILALIGVTGVAFTESVTLFGAIAGIGIFIVIIGILVVAAMTARSRSR